MMDESEKSQKKKRGPDEWPNVRKSVGMIKCSSHAASRDSTANSLHEYIDRIKTDPAPSLIAFLA